MPAKHLSPKASFDSETLVTGSSPSLSSLEHQLPNATLPSEASIQRLRFGSSRTVSADSPRRKSIQFNFGGSAGSSPFPSRSSSTRSRGARSQLDLLERDYRAVSSSGRASSPPPRYCCQSVGIGKRGRMPSAPVASLQPTHT